MFVRVRSREITENMRVLFCLCALACPCFSHKDMDETANWCMMMCVSSRVCVCVFMLASTDDTDKWPCDLDGMQHKVCNAMSSLHHDNPKF